MGCCVVKCRSNNDVRCITIRDLDDNPSVYIVQMGCYVPLAILFDRWAQLLEFPPEHIQLIHVQGQQNEEYLKREDTMRLKDIRDGDSIHSWIMNLDATDSE